MPKSSRVMALKQASTLETYVFEVESSDAEALMEFSYQDLKRWGFDLFFGNHDGK